MKRTIFLPLAALLVLGLGVFAVRMRAQEDLTKSPSDEVRKLLDRAEELEKAGKEEEAREKVAMAELLLAESTVQLSETDRIRVGQGEWLVYSREWHEKMRRQTKEMKELKEQVHKLREQGKHKEALEAMDKIHKMMRRHYGGHGGRGQHAGHGGRHGPRGHRSHHGSPRGGRWGEHDRPHGPRMAHHRGGYGGPHGREHDGPGPRIHHLHRAAEHLRAAGYPEHAERVNKLSKELRQRMGHSQHRRRAHGEVRKLRKEMAGLRDEIRQLRKLVQKIVEHREKKDSI